MTGPKHINYVVCTLILGTIFETGCHSDDDTAGDTETVTDSGRVDAETDSGTSDPASDTVGYSNMGICGLEGEAAVIDDTFEGTEDRYLIGDGGDGKDLCRVRFDVEGVGTPSVSCEDCEWTHIIEYSNPQVVAEVDGLCTDSELALDDERIAAIAGSRRSVGYIRWYAGHSNVLMLLNDDSVWVPIGFSTYIPETGELFYGRDDGFCGY